MSDSFATTDRPNAEAGAGGTRIAVLGTGIMGFPMAARLAEAGFTVTVWNRTRAKAAPLAERGATIADTPADAVRDAQICLTMLTDARAVAAAMDGPDGALDAMPDGAVWLQMSTVGEQGWQQLAGLAERSGVTVVDAPVLGTRKPAEDGTLRILAAGPADALQRCQPVFDVLGSVLPGVGAAGAGSLLKLAVNSWLLAITDATATALTLAAEFDLDGHLFLDAIAGSASDCAYAHVKGEAMMNRQFAASFTAAAAAKDAHLVAEAAGRRPVDTAVIDAIAGHFDDVVEQGHGDDDMAAVVRAVSRR